MNPGQSTHQFADAATAQIPGLRGHDCQLIIRQQPQNARVAVGKEKDRKPVDPPPIIQLKISSASDPGQNYLQSPYFFMACSLIGETEGGIPSGTLGTALAGTLVSSLHRLKDSDNSDGAFFVFGDLSVKVEGSFRLQFTLYEMRNTECYHVKAIMSDPFPVHSTKTFPGMSESTFLTRSFSDQGVRLRLRKEPRTLLRKRGPAHDDYQPRHYRNRQSSQGVERQSVTSAESQEAGRQTQNDSIDVLEAQHQHPAFEHRPQIGRHFSQQTSASYAGSISYEEPSKRPRTGSEQGQPPAFGQGQALDSPQFPGRMYSDSQQAFPAYGQQTTQTAQYGFAYAQSPSSTSSREQYFAQRVPSQTGTTSPFDPNSQRSPQNQFFPPQPQAIRYPQQQGQYGSSQVMGASPPQRVETAQNAFEGLGLTSRGQVSPAMGGPTISLMAPPTYGRMNTSPTYATLPSSATPRRDSYQGYPSQHQNLSAGSMAAGGMAAGLYGRPPAVTTSGPGTLESSF